MNPIISSQTYEFIQDHLKDDVRLLALQAAKYPEIDMPLAITQISGRQSIIHKIPSWYAIKELLYPSHLSLEQCSSELTATYKSSLMNGETLVDLTGGFGVDCAFIASNFKMVSYVEKQKELSEIAKNNFSVLGLDKIAVYNEDSSLFLKQMEPVDCIFIDPARRNEHGGKSVLLSDCEPDVEELQDILLQKARKVMIKLSPMLDVSLALHSLPKTSGVHIISVQNECKELLLLLGHDSVNEVPVRCINFAGGSMQEFTFTREAETIASCRYADHPKQYLYEPNSSILKAGGYKSIALAYEVEKLHPNSHLYTSDVYIENFPGRSFRVTDWSSVKDKTLILGIKKANISVRNFPLTAAELRKQLKLTDGGDTYLFATTLMNKKKILIKCEKT